jgi:hypothetical protein
MVPHVRRIADHDIELLAKIFAAHQEEITQADVARASRAI